MVYIARYIRVCDQHRGNREWTSKTKTGKAARPSGFVSEMVKSAGEKRTGMITELIHQIIVEVAIPVEKDLSKIVNCTRQKEML